MTRKRNMIARYHGPSPLNYGQVAKGVEIVREGENMSVEVRDDRGHWHVCLVPYAIWRDFAHDLAKEAGLMGSTGDED